MKLFKAAFFLLLLVGTSFTVSANTPGPKENLEKQLSKIITNSTAWGKIDQTVEFQIELMINDNGEIIVKSTTNENYDDIVKGLLNYRKLVVSDAFKSIKIILPIKLELV